MEKEKSLKVILTKNFYDGYQLHKKGKEMILPESVVFKSQPDKDGKRVLCGCFQLVEKFEAPKPMPGPKTRPVQDVIQKPGSDVI